MSGWIYPLLFFLFFSFLILSTRCGCDYEGHGASDKVTQEEDILWGDLGD